jgi:ADP-heptose:LPS heptosyltransferase
VLGQFSRVPRQNAGSSLPPVPPNEVIHIGARKRLLSLILYLAAILLRFLALFRKAKPDRVLVLEPVGLGDLISFDPLVRELLKRNYEVVICAKPEWRPLFAEQPRQKWVDLRLPWATHDEQIKYEIGRYFREPTRTDLRNLRAIGSGAIGLDTRGDIRSVLLLYWAGCKRVISLSNYLGSDLPMSSLAAELIPFDNSLRRWELNLRFLRALDRDADLAVVGPPRLNHLIQKSRSRRVALMPIAPWAGKLWPRERWIAITKALREKSWEVVGLCGPKQSETAREQIGPDVPLTECGSIESWAREFNQCTFVITVDSGPMHLADALDVPVIALFGQGKLPLWAPSGTRSVPLARRDADFFVCHPIVANTHLGQKYMDRITVADVLAEVDGMSMLQNV